MTIFWYTFSAAYLLSSGLNIQVFTHVPEVQKKRPEQSAVPVSAPWQRLLKGDEAKHVKDLEQQISDLSRAGKFDEAVAPALEVQATRTRLQGKEH